MLPTTQQQYVVRNPSIGTGGKFSTSLKLETASIPPLKEHEALIRIHAVSLNFRDVMVAAGTYPWETRDGVVPCSDGAGEVLAVGARVRRVRVGQRVMSTFFPTYIEGKFPLDELHAALGGVLDGMLREYAICSEEALVSVPEYLSMEEACTLPCAAVTAWNALMGGGMMVRAGETVLTQGTGGVSLFAAQIAIAAGAHVIGTTGSVAKKEVLEMLGVEHVIDYRQTPDRGEEAKKLANESWGVDFVVEIGGRGTLEQSLKAIRGDGVISCIGRRANGTAVQSKPGLLLMDALLYPCTLRRIMVGSRDQFEAMNRFFEQFKIRPTIDRKVFSFKDAPQAFEYLNSQDHVGKVVIRIFEE